MLHDPITDQCRPRCLPLEQPVLEARIELIDETIEALLAHRQTLCVQITQRRTTAKAASAADGCGLLARLLFSKQPSQEWAGAAWLVHRPFPECFRTEKIDMRKRGLGHPAPRFSTVWCVLSLPYIAPVCGEIVRECPLERAPVHTYYITIICLQQSPI